MVRPLFQKIRLSILCNNTQPYIKCSLENFYSTNKLFESFDSSSPIV